MTKIMFAVIVTVTIVCLGFLTARPAEPSEIFLLPQCRVLDTRNIGGPLQPGQDFNFDVRGQVGGTQGGSANCGIPIEASGVIISTTVLGALGAGHLEIYPYQHRPALPTSRLNYITAVAENSELHVSVTQGDGSESPSIPDITIRPSVSAVHVIADVVGYTADPRPTFAVIRGRTISPAQQDSEGFWNIVVQTVSGGDTGCSNPDSTCKSISCSKQAGAGNVCAVTISGECIEVQGYFRPFSSSPGWGYVGTVVRLFPPGDPCPWE